MFWTHAPATICMYTKAQGYLLLLLFPTAKAESAISVDKSELKWLFLKDHAAIFLVMEMNFEGRVWKKKKVKKTKDELEVSIQLKRR